MDIQNFGNFARDNFLITIAIVLYISGYFPFIYNIYKKKSNNQKFKNEYYYLIIMAFILILIHSIAVNHYEIALFCLIKIIIIILIIMARVLYT